MKNLRGVSCRIKKAIREKEKIVLYADADMDGVASIIILEEVIKELGGKAVLYISDRKKWNYGLSKKAVIHIKKESPALLITLDCGISNFDGAKEAKKNKFELIIIDHHKVFSKKPEASLILNPLQEGDNYPFKKLANAGITYKLAEDILKEKFEKKKRFFLELTTLATIADKVPKEEDNKEILDEGLKALRKPSIFSLNMLKKAIEENFVESCVSLLNITKPKKDRNVAYFFLTTEDKKETEKMILELKKEREKRKEKLKKEEQRIVKKIKNEEPIIFQRGYFLPHLSGAIASRVIKNCKKPVFLYVIEDSIAYGSVRGFPNQDVVEAMEYCKKHLLSFGGHAVAAGFSLKEENIEKFKSCLIDYFKKNS